MAFPGIVYSGDNAKRGPSPAIWKAMLYPTDLVRENANFGAEWWDDFLSISGDGSPMAAQTGTIVTSAGSYKAQVGPTTFGTVAPVATGAAAGPSIISEDIGAISFKSLAAAHDNAALEPGSTGNTPVGRWGISGTIGNLPKVAFECKIKLDAADATQAFFVGLAEANLTSAQNTLFNATEVLQNKSMIGLYANATATIQPVYGKNGAAFVNVGSGGTLVANTYTKLGWFYDPGDSVNGVLRFFQDGVQIGRVATLPASTAFPSGVALTPLLYVQNAGAGGVARLMTCDWLRVGEVIDQ